MGLFGESIGTLRNVGLEDVDVTSGSTSGFARTGSLAGWNNGTVTHSWASGSVTGVNNVGGLIGEQGQFQGALTSASYSHASVSGADNVGGLVGHVANGNVLATYATGSVTGTSDVGGLVGYNTEGAITASYATGGVSGSENVGGLAGGWFDGFGATITSSYHDAQTTGRVFGSGDDDNGSGTNADNNVLDAGETNRLLGGLTGALQSPTGYTGIYANWNLDLDNADDDGSHSTGQDDPWDFGANDEYPILRNVGGFQRLTDYDTDDDGLIDMDTLAKLDAIRYDLDGDGTATDDAYDDAFLGPMANMGCPATGCTGYELTADLDFDENGDDSITSADAAYWNGGAGWDPIGDSSNPFTTVFEGNGHTISNLFISRGATSAVGLFGVIGSGGVVRNVGLVDADVTGSSSVGALAGVNQGRVVASWAIGGAVTGNHNGGGLVGYNDSLGVVSASYAAVSVSNSGGSNFGGLAGINLGEVTASYATGSVKLPSSGSAAGGLVGLNEGGSITASYATGAVSASVEITIGGLVGSSTGGAITDSYWDTERSGQETSAGGTGKTGAELRAPTGYTGIYANWNLDLDGDSANDNPWDFGADYNNPTLRQAGGKQQGPGPVSGLTAVPSESTGQSSNLVVTWSAPTDRGDGTLGDPLAGIYVVRHDNEVGDTWRTTIISLETVADFGTTYTIASPVADAYRVEVWAIGAGAAHTEGKRVRIGLPGPPMMGLTSFDRRIDVSWSAHADTGGSAISGYHLQYRLVGPPVMVNGESVPIAWTTLTLPSAATSRSFTGLDAGETYEFRLAATNADGTGVYAGPFSAIASAVIDYDSDGDGLLEIRTLEQLNAVRWDVDGDGMVTDDTGTADVDEAAIYVAAFPQAAPNMGCPMTGCTGYELMADLDFDVDGNGVVDANDGRTDTNGDSVLDAADDADVDADDDDNIDGGAFWNGGAGWRPLGTGVDKFVAVFEGNGHTIANLFFDRGPNFNNWDRVGLFGRLGDDGLTPPRGATIRNLVLTGASVAGDDRVGILTGQTYSTTTISNVRVSGAATGRRYVGGLIGVVGEDTRISRASASGSVTASNNQAGGLVGENKGDIAASYAAVAVSGNANVGGLVGHNDDGAILASYATGSVNSNASNVGGVVGLNGGDIIASYSTGAVSRSGGSTLGVGGLVGNDDLSGTVSNSYWDTESSGQSTSRTGTGKTGAELRAPTAYGSGTDIYANWNLDLDNADGDNSHSTGQDNPWDFGAAHNYPTLRNAPGNQKGPGPVRDMTATRPAGETTVRWTAPLRSGDGAITGYEYRISTDGGSTWDSPGWAPTRDDVRLHTFSAQPEGSYTVEARAVSDAAHQRGVAQRLVPPQNAPQNLSVLLYTGRVDLFWDAPHDDGGPDVTGYAVQYKASSDTAWLTANVVITGRSASITGLTNGTTYKRARCGGERPGRGDVLRRHRCGSHGDPAPPRSADRPDPDSRQPAHGGVLDGAQGPGQPAPHRLLGAVPGGGSDRVVDLGPQRRRHDRHHHRADQ